MELMKVYLSSDSYHTVITSDSVWCHLHSESGTIESLNWMNRQPSFTAMVNPPILKSASRLWFKGIFICTYCMKND